MVKKKIENEKSKVKVKDVHLYYYYYYSLQKDPTKRPNYKELMNHPFILKYENVDVDMSSWVKQALKNNKLKNDQSA